MQSHTRTTWTPPFCEYPPPPHDYPYYWFMSWWRHQMETLSALLAICAGNSSHPKASHGALMFSLICAWINGWVSNGEASDLIRHHAHYDVPVISHPKSNQDRVKVTNLNKMAKIQYLELCKENLHTTHLLITMCKWEMEWVRLVLYCGNYKAEMILSRERQNGETRYRETSIPSFNFVEQGIYLYTSVPSQMLMIKASFSSFSIHLALVTAEKYCA